MLFNVNLFIKLVKWYSPYFLSILPGGQPIAPALNKLENDILQKDSTGTVA